MKGNRLVILSGLVVLAVGYAIYDYQSEILRAEKKEIETRVVSVEPDQVNEITIYGNEKISLKKNQQGWQLEHPISELADSGAVDEFIKGLTLEKYTQVIKQGGEIQWKDYGLDTPQGRISFKTNSGQVFEIKVSSVKNYQGDSYLHVNDDSRVLLASSTWYIKLEKKPIDFRDKRLFKGLASDVLSLHFSTKNEKFSLVKKDDKWVLSEKSNLKLDQNKVRELMTSFSTAQATDILEKNAIASSQKTSMITFNLPEKKVWSGEFFKNKNGDTFFYQMGGSVYKISSSDFDSMAQVKSDRFRDRREPFAFSKNEAQVVELETQAKKTELKRVNENWAIQPQTDGYDVDQVKVKSLLSKLESLQIEDFTQSKVFKSTQAVMLKKVDGSLLFSLLIGDVKKDHEKTTFYAKTNLYPDIFTLSEDSVKNLSLEEIIIKKPVENGNSSK